MNRDMAKRIADLLQAKNGGNQSDLARYLEGIKAVQFYAGGKLILERMRIESVLTCYLEACACNDHRAHCNKVVTTPFTGGFADNDVVSLDLDDLRAPAVLT